TGFFKGNLAIPGTNLISNLDRPFLCKFDQFANLVWAFQLDGVSGLSLALDSARNMYVAGAAAHSIGFLARLSTTGPPLNVGCNTNALVVSWSALAEGFALESTDAVNPASWTTVPTNMVVATAVANTVVAPRNLPQQFFRLRRP